eukprot:1991458-Pyramimonas_sp.AAC.1
MRRCWRRPVGRRGMALCPPPRLPKAGLGLGVHSLELHVVERAPREAAPLRLPQPELRMLGRVVALILIVLIILVLFRL